MKNARISLTIFTVLFKVATSITYAQPSYPTNPENAQLVYTDVENFVEAFEQLKTTTDTLAVLNKYYFDPGTAGLKEYIIKHALTPGMLKNAIAKNPDRYAKIEGFLANKAVFGTEFNEVMQNFGQILPNAMYPPTYLLVGANRGIAQASKVGQLVTVTRVVDNGEKLKKLIVHELAHFQQALSMGIEKYGSLYTQKNNMLALCLREGGAEFVTSLVLNQITQTKSLGYLTNNESELKLRFIRDLAAQDTKFWLWESIDDPSAPKLMGYVMGYKICEAYYKKATNEQKALEMILIMPDPESFLKISGYFKE
tara:strand:- start:9114 stop:10046 length:933 start_codon:yes stop_codon:yes gene_type:complete